MARIVTSQPTSGTNAYSETGLNDLECLNSAPAAISHNTKNDEPNEFSPSTVHLLPYESRLRLAPITIQPVALDKNNPMRMEMGEKDSEQLKEECCFDPNLDGKPFCLVCICKLFGPCGMLLRACGECTNDCLESCADSCAKSCDDEGGFVSDDSCFCCGYQCRDSSGVWCNKDEQDSDMEDSDCCGCCSD